jgi:septal ring-binding cell division protein DamX
MPDEAASLQKNPYEIALASYRAGNLAEAAGLWQEMLRGEGPEPHTLQIAAACQEDNIRNNFRIFEKFGQPLAIPVRIKGRDCYRLCLGAYPSAAAAKESLASLPVTAGTQGLIGKRISLPPRRGPTPAVPAALPSEPSSSPTQPSAPPPAPVEKAVSGEELYQTALASYLAGNLSEAVSSWKTMLAGKPSGTYTLQIAAACEEKTIMENFRAFEEFGQPFAVPFRTGGRECFRLCLGTYPSKRAAKRTLAALPAARGKGLIIKNVNLLLR